MRTMEAGDPVLVKDDYIADLWDEGPLSSFVQLEAGCTGVIDHFGDNGEVCISFYDYYYVIADIDDFDYDGVFMVNYSQKQKDMILREAMRPLFHLIKDEDN